MKTIPFFLFFVIVCCAFSTAPAVSQQAYSPPRTDAFGKDSRSGFSAQVRTGIFYGQSEEIVYWDSQSPDYKSQLLWDIKPLAYAGAGLSFSTPTLRNAPGFSANLSFAAGIPGGTGIMEDRDWQNTSDHSILTNYSAHDNYTLRAFLTDFALGVSIPLTRRDQPFAFLTLQGAVSYRYFDWMARDGYYQYEPGNTTKPWDPSDPQTPVYGDLIGYSQQWLIISPGLTITIPVVSRWLVAVSLNVSPGLIWAWALDEHLPVYEFQDRPTGGVLLEPRLEISYAFNARLALTGTASYRYIQGSRGDSRTRIPSKSVSYPWNADTAGAGFNAVDAGLALNVFF
ncbi:MAG: omptin family outer membrane protease [Spirochaetaceae bacterium]|jgi:outer membrane protease|nr:omptin family outer membrane protease [Spirochaetaceae bacterium]